MLRKVCDDPAFYLTVATSEAPLASFFSKFTAPVTSTGLFNNPYLTNPGGLHTFAVNSLEQAKALVADITARGAQAAEMDAHARDTHDITRKLDQLSDVLCRVLDLCGYVRELHPSHAFRRQAQLAHEMLYEYMNELNTNEDIYLALKYAMETPANLARWSSEDVAVGQILMNDFENSGLHMASGAGNTREGFVSLTQEIAVLGQTFQQGVGRLALGHVALTPEEADRVPRAHTMLGLARAQGKSKRRVALQGTLPYQLLRSCPEESVRRKIWIAIHSPAEQQEQLLEALLVDRALLARLMGSNSYAEYNLKLKMARTPEQVMEFLTAVMDVQRPKLDAELATLRAIKMQGTCADADVMPWDLTYLKTQLAIQKPSKQTESHLDYFSVGTVLRGISELFQSIYGIHFRSVPVLSGESWHQDVRKIEIVCEEEGVIGIMYLDLFLRPDKNGHPAHYNIVCARKVFADEFADANTSNGNFSPAGVEEVFQLPVIALVCDFAKNDPDHTTSLLHQHQVETLFHEFGHAIHSMLGRTIYHSISGTRTPSDFVEVPLILMESFARDPRVLARMGRHYETGQPISEQAVRLMVDHGATFPALELFSTLKLAAVDMALHGEEVLRAGRPRAGFAARIAHRVERDFGVLADTYSNGQAQCSHLNSYGANYYSYVLGKLTAQRIWDKWFVTDPYARSGGTAFRAGVLKWGGGRDPWRMLADVLEIEALAKGDKQAMRILAGDK
ncbi:hypothetical protein BABINDRAFT_63599 [Babjeviella inositovora NRRL Y-12698]|uniref:Mitochondrial intermediate peptidase n=1 Tax=Babjeviella inositovora NRRL Y-12698 TaxID=984486 RepID=A0A1E3QMZ8_9ASCO|nr:uncharacterized protein BABINDRAFT_63599 [Babjeviella inositovora NRRL Y-12698]ODQ79008.1 hypothetical protein BABINDRAFT_63599 [Babjeviella inositovora NRRL Y-12698]